MDNLQGNDLFSILKQSWSVHGADHFSCLIALSGGVDSVVLLDLLCRLRQEIDCELHAIHIHHGLQKPADSWAEFCRQLCKQYQVSLDVIHVEINPHDPAGIEAAAREARYQALCEQSLKHFSGSLKPLIALAHHQDDQLETFMLSVLRGGGLRGLCAMPEKRLWHNQVFLWRPLLSISRQAIQDYAEHHHLVYIQDPSNDDIQYTRNRLRHRVLPELLQTVPNAREQIISNIAQLQNTLKLVEETVSGSLKNSMHDGVLNLSAWKNFSLPLRLEILHAFGKHHGVTLPSHKALRDFANHLYQNPQQHHLLACQTWQLIAQYQRLWAFPSRLENPPYTWQQATHGLPEKDYAIRQVRQGDTITIKNGHKKVLRLLQEKKIPAFIRPLWQVAVNQNDECVAVVGIRCDETISIPNGWVPVMPILQPFLAFSSTGSLKDI